MKKLFLLSIAILILTGLSAQEEKKKFKFKKPNLKLGEKIGDLTGKLLTSKTSELDEVVAKAYVVSGVYPPEINTTESKYYPAGTIEGDYVIGVTFLKGAGMGMFEVDGSITNEGNDLEYVSLGSYLKVFREPFTEPKTIDIKTSSGDIASIQLTPTAGVEIISVNGENSLPIIDLDEDIELTYLNPPGSENTRIRVSLLTKVMGVKALNRFTDFKAGNVGEVTVTIPKESLSNPEIAGSVKGVANYSKGENFLIVERELITTRDNMGSEQNIGDLQTAELKATSYASIPVIVKGKQEESVYASIKVNQKTTNNIGYTFYKPNANSGIPFSKGSKFGLTSFTLEGKTFKQNTTTTERYGYGNTRIITTTTTTYQFPQLPDSQWEYVMDKIYTSFAEFMKTEYSITFVPVEDIISNSYYKTLFPAADKNTDRIIRTSYKGTQRVDAKSIGEIIGSVSSNLTSDNTIVNMMEESDVDGLLSLNLSFQVAGNKAGNVILIPTLSLNILGRDEENNNKQGNYGSAFIAKTTGNPFNGDMVKANPEALAAACSTDEMIEALINGIKALRAKELELGYDKIWNIGQ